MDIKKKILSKLIDTDEEFLYIISHHPIVYLPLMIISILGIIILFFLYNFLSVYFPRFATYFIWFLTLFLYFYFVLGFLDIYLDALVVTSRSVVIYQWYWLFKNTIDVLDFEAIESIFADQSWLIDILFNKGDLNIRRAWHTNIFPDVYNPNKVANELNSLIFKQQVSEEEEISEENNENFDEEKVKLLAKAMLEVMKEMK